jgi:hypothetical protein
MTRSPHRRRFTVIALVLTIAGIGLTIFLDNRYGHWLSSHPLTSNLTAGLLGLPAAFLIVNLAAERALSLAEQSSWMPLRVEEINDLIHEWRTARKSFEYRFSIEEVDDEVEMDLFYALRRMIGYFDKPPQVIRPASPEELRNLLDILKLSRTKYGDKFAIQREEEFRRRAQTLLLPRLESAEIDPEIVSGVRYVSDWMTELDSSLSGLAPHWDTYHKLLELSTQKDFPCDLSQKDIAKVREYLSAYDRVTHLARKTLWVMDDFVLDLRYRLRTARQLDDDEYYSEANPSTS